jgi:hypothetical protein
MLTIGWFAVLLGVLAIEWADGPFFLHSFALSSLRAPSARSCRSPELPWVRYRPAFGRASRLLVIDCRL